MNNFFQKYVCCCCNNENDEEQVNERTSLLNNQIDSATTNEIPIYLPSNDENSTLNKILHRTANDIIDIGASDNVVYDPYEGTNQVKHYRDLVSKISHDYLQANFAPHICSTNFSSVQHKAAAELITGNEKHKKDLPKLRQDAVKESNSKISAFQINRLLGHKFKKNSSNSKDLTGIKSSQLTPSDGDDENIDTKQMTDKGIDHDLATDLENVLSTQAPQPNTYVPFEKAGEWLEELRTSIASIKIHHKEDFLIQL